VLVVYVVGAIRSDEEPLLSLITTQILFVTSVCKQSWNTAFASVVSHHQQILISQLVELLYIRADINIAFVGSVFQDVFILLLLPLKLAQYPNFPAT
jgi:hypothetical protein